MAHEEDKKLARLEARVQPAVHALLLRAAALQGRSMSDFVVSAAREAAEQAIAQYEMIHLSLADQERFAEALLDPPPLTPPLEQAFEAHDQLIEPA